MRGGLRQLRARCALPALCSGAMPPTGDRDGDNRLLAQVGQRAGAPRGPMMRRSATDHVVPRRTQPRSVQTLFTVRTLLLAAIRRSSTCRAQRGRSCERGARVGGRCSLIVWPFELRKKTCHSNVAIARAKHEAFGRSEEAFMANWGPKVTQLGPLTLVHLKTKSVTMPDPSRPPRHPWPRPGPSQ